MRWVLHRKVKLLFDLTSLPCNWIPQTLQFTGTISSFPPLTTLQRGHEMEMFDNNVQRSTMFCNVKAMWMCCEIHQLFIKKGRWNIGKILNFSSSFINCLSPACLMMVHCSKGRMHLQTATECSVFRHVCSCVFVSVPLVYLSSYLPPFAYLNTWSLSVWDNVINHYKNH